MRRHPFFISSKQRGSALIISLSILLVLTILGVSALSTSSLEEKMAGNTRDQQVAFEAAETGLRAAEIFVGNPAADGLFDLTGSAGLFEYTGSLIDVKANTSWNNAISVATTADVARNPEYIIQQLQSDAGQVANPNATAHGYGEGGDGEVLYYQITARGYGISPNSRVMLQSYFSKKK